MTRSSGATTTPEQQMATGEVTLMGIGDAARMLDQEFGDVTVSKIRYLESRGLVTPARTRGGSRRFSSEDLQRLRYIINCQRTQFLPLEIIARHLDEGLHEQPSRSPAHAQGDDHERPMTDHSSLAHLLRPRAMRGGQGAKTSGKSQGRSATGDDATMTPEEFTAHSKCTAEQIDQLRQHGFITQWDSTELEVCHIISRLGHHGIEPRHLRWLIQSAERVESLVDAGIPLRHDLSTLASAEQLEARRQLAGDLMAVQLLMIRRGLGSQPDRG